MDPMLMALCETHRMSGEGNRELETGRFIWLLIFKTEAYPKKPYG
jgi:hypothetical protein